MKVKEYVVIALIVILANWLFKDSKTINEYRINKNEIIIKRDSILRTYDQNKKDNIIEVDSIHDDSLIYEFRRLLESI